MNYNEALEYIHSLSRFGSIPGLESICELTRRLKNPQDGLKFIHIAGTNGKGTITTLLASILCAQGYKTGAYTSPFVDHFCERIAIDGKYISEDDLGRLTGIIKEECDRMVSDGLAHPTEFEVITALAFLYFKEQGCDYVVLEVGLGGRLDATNIIKSPICSIITSISYDHMSVLGNTLSEIAAEKCGIIKEGSPVVLYPEQDADVLDVVKNFCKNKNADLRLANMPQIQNIGLNGTLFNYPPYKNLLMPLIGAHMAKNAATALCTVGLLNDMGIEISLDAVEKGFSLLHHPGRMEKISDKPLVITDGAHNLSGIHAFRDSVKALFEGKNIVFIMGMLRDKEYKRAIEAIADIPDRFITIDIPSPRTLTAEELAFEIKKYKKDVVLANGPKEALELAKKGSPDVIFVLGSLYLLGEFKRLF